jgi:hypothetical protein
MPCPWATIAGVTTSRRAVVTGSDDKSLDTKHRAGLQHSGHVEGRRVAMKKLGITNTAGCAAPRLFVGTR